MSFTDRQKLILGVLSNSKRYSSSQILNILSDQYGVDISKDTLVRDLNRLIKNDVVSRTGRTGRYLKYYVKEKHPLFSYLDIDSYLSQDLIERDSKPTFDFDIFNHLHSLLSKDELENIKQETLGYQERLKKLPKDIIWKETERLTIELSWKSSQIEGNTYSILETETLLREKVEAKGHDKMEATMLLNHKKTIEYIIKNKEEYKILSKEKILAIHKMLIEDMDIYSGFRGNIIGITGTKYVPLIGKSRVIEAIEKMMDVVNSKEQPIEKALIILVMISYIQAFSDGNKRTGRILSNAILLAYGYCPLSFRSVDPTEYKKGLLIFYEQNNLSYFKKLFVEQYLYSVRNYYRNS